jgi:hypothetical protein
MKRSLILLAALAMSIIVAVPALAITKGGTLDGEDHPYAAMSVYDQGDDGWRCSGAFIDPHTYVTAGHCAFGAEAARVYLETDVQAGIPGNGYPGPGGTAIEADAAYTHPLYDDNQFYLYDVGVLKFVEPVELDEYASLPGLNAMDVVGHGRNNPDALVTAVGYGLQNAHRNQFDGRRTRYQATLMVLDTNGVAGLAHANPGQSASISGDSKHGGTCFGDSGGPILAGTSDTIWMVNSFGLNGTCSGIGGGYRIDRADDLDFLNDVEGIGDLQFPALP